MLTGCEFKRKNEEQERLMKMTQKYPWQFSLNGVVLAVAAKRYILRGMQEVFPEGVIELSDKAWEELQGELAS